MDRSAASDEPSCTTSEIAFPIYVKLNERTKFFLSILRYAEFYLAWPLFLLQRSMIVIRWPPWDIRSCKVVSVV